MMNECPIYLIPASQQFSSTPSPLPSDEVSCGGCSCGYIQYESLIPYLTEIKHEMKYSEEDSMELEFKLRSMIVEISRLFDIDAGVTEGYFSKAHFYTKKVYNTNNTKYLQVDPFVEGSLEIRNMDMELIDTSYYDFVDGHLVFLPCETHNSCQCSTTCGDVQRIKRAPWPESCYYVTAKWGKECSDYAVQKAVRDYLIESLRLQDPVVQTATGIPFQRTFKVPHSWTTYIANFRNRKRFFSSIAIA